MDNTVAKHFFFVTCLFLMIPVYNVTAFPCFVKHDTLSNFTALVLSGFCVQEEENRLREELRQEWELKQEKIKSEF